MSNASVPMTELPKYRSHKIVQALKIAAIEIHEDKSATIAPFDARYAPFKTRPGWADRFTGSEADAGYYVVYEDSFASWSPTEAFQKGYTRIRDQDSAEDASAKDRAKQLMNAVMLTWDPPRSFGGESYADVAQTATMLAIAYIMGQEFLPELTENQKIAVDGGLDLLHKNMTPPTLEEWIDRWRAGLEAGQTNISRDEAVRRYRQSYGRPSRPNGED